MSPTTRCKHCDTEAFVYQLQCETCQMRLIVRARGNRTNVEAMYAALERSPDVDIDSLRARVAKYDEEH